MVLQLNHLSVELQANFPSMSARRCEALNQGDVSAGGAISAKGSPPMKRVALLGSTALFGAGMMAHGAMAADGIKLGVGGFFNEAYMATFDDDGEGELGNEHNTDGFFNDAEVHFTGSTVLDNGLEVGARVELEGETQDEQIGRATLN